MTGIRITSEYYSSGDRCIICPYGGARISNCCGEKCIYGTPYSIASEEQIEEFENFYNLEQDEED